MGETATTEPLAKLSELARMIEAPEPAWRFAPYGGALTPEEREDPGYQVKAYRDVMRGADPRYAVGQQIETRARVEALRGGAPDEAQLGELGEDPEARQWYQHVHRTWKQYAPLYSLAANFVASGEDSAQLREQVHRIPKEERALFMDFVNDIRFTTPESAVAEGVKRGTRTWLENARAFVDEYIGTPSYTGPNPSLMAPGPERDEAERKLRAAEKKDIDAVEADRFYRKAQSVRRSGIYQPADMSIAKRGLVFAAENLPQMATGAVATGLGGPAAGVAFWTMPLTAGALDEFREAGIDDKYAKPLALMSGTIEAIVEHFQVKGLTPKLRTGLAKAMRTSLKGFLARKIARGLLTYGSEFGEEVVQAGVRYEFKRAGVFMDKNAPELDYQEEFARVRDELIAAAQGLPFLMLPGAAIETAAGVRDIRVAKQTLLDLEGAKRFVAENPEAAEAFIAKEKPTRADAEAITAERTSAAERAKMVDFLKRAKKAKDFEVVAEGVSAPEPVIQPTAREVADAERAAREARPEGEEARVEPREDGGVRPWDTGEGREAAAVEAAEEEAVEAAPVVTPPKTVADLPDAKQANETTWYHGSVKPGMTASTVNTIGFSNIGNLFGQGLYLTDNPDIAKQYADRKGTGGQVYSAQVNVRNVLNFEKAIPADAVAAIRRAVYPEFRGAVDAAAKKPGATGTSVWEALTEAVSEQSHQEGVGRSEYIEMFQTIQDYLREGGYDGIVHMGGERVGKKRGGPKHRVLILLDPTSSGMPVGVELPRSLVRFDAAEAPAEVLTDPDVVARAEVAGPQGNPFDIPVSMAPGPATAPLAPHKIISDMSKAFGIPIRLGHIRQKAAGIYKKLPQVARLKGKHAGDLAVATHEVAHHIDATNQIRKGLPLNLRKELKALDYEPEKGRTEEGFAEYMRIALTEGAGPAAQAAPDFNDWFVNTWMPANPQTAIKLGHVRAAIETWAAQGAEGRVEGAINRTGKIDDKTPMQKVAQAVRTVRGLMDDDLHALEVASKKIQSSLKEQGKPIERGKDPYVIARVLGKSASAMAVDSIERGVFSLVDGRRLAGGIKPALALIPYEDGDAFVSYIYARHALDVWQPTTDFPQGRNPGISQADAQFVFNKYAMRPEFQAAGNQLTDWNKAMIHMVAEVGGLSAEAEALITQAFPSYIPLKRVVDSMKKAGIKSGFLDVRAPVRRLRGSGRQIQDPIASMVQSASQFYTAASKMVVAQALINAAEEAGGMGDLVEQIPAPLKTMATRLENMQKQLEAAGADLTDADMTALVSITQAAEFQKGGEPIAVVYRDGKPQWFQFHPELYRSITSMEAYRLPHLLNATLGLATKITRAGAVSLRASFGFGANPIRDIKLALIQTEGSMVRMLYRGLGNVFRRLLSAIRVTSADPLLELYTQYGGMMSTYLGQDMASAYQFQRDLFNSAHGRMTFGIVKTPMELLNMVQEVLSVTEVAPRLAEMQATLERRGWTDVRKRLKSGEQPPMAILMEALLDAAEVTTDFKRRGAVMQTMNRVEAFSNAKIQGVVQPIRKMRKNPLRYFSRAAAILTIPTLAMWWKYRDEDWYEELEPWQRFFYWNIKLPNSDRVVRIPRPFEVGMLFASTAEAIADSLYREDPERGWQFAGELFPGIHEMADFVIPDGVQPALEIIMNYDLWRKRPIVSKQLARLKPEDQFYQYNTAASRYLGHWLNASPAQIDYLMSNYTGRLGTDLLRVPEEGITRAVGYGRFVKSVTKGASINEFYKAVDTVEGEYNSARTKGTLTADLAERWAQLRHARDMMREIRSIGKRDYNKESYDALQRYITALARWGLGKEPLETYPMPTWEALEEVLRTNRQTGEAATR